jgi:hypothetical protein
VSRKLESTGRRRKILVCIGSPRICSASQLGRFGRGSFYQDWVDAVGAAARANFSVYALLALCARVSGEGIVEVAGGTAFRNASDFRPLLDRIWQDAGHHYLARVLAADLVERAALDQREGGAQRRPRARASSARQLTELFDGSQLNPVR